MKKIVLGIFAFVIVFYLSFFLPQKFIIQGVRKKPLHVSTNIFQKERHDEKLPKPPSVPVESYLIADLDSAFVFAKKDSHKILPIASLTKLMTAIIVTENVPLEKSILITPEMLQGYGSTQGLEAGKKFKAFELLFPLLIESSNDAAWILSYFLGKEKTIDLMNQKAKMILMKDTYFADPSGLDPKNLSSAKDLFHLSQYIIKKHPFLLKISKGEKVLSFEKLPVEIKDLRNKNIFFDTPNFIGGKTGYLIESKNVGLFIFQFLNQKGERQRIVFIILGSNSLQKDTQALYQWVKDGFSLAPKMILPSNEK